MITALEDQEIITTEFANHIKKYGHNRKFITHGINNRSQEYNDWEIVALFYAAIHLIEAVLAKKCNVTVGSHDERYEKMDSNRRIFSFGVLRNYKELKNQAILARYYASASFPNSLASDMHKKLDEIEFELRAYMAS